jgi:hypothetical protein
MMAPAMKEAQVICAGVSYFESREVLDASGNPRKDDRGIEIKVDVRLDARLGEIIKISEPEYERLALLDAVQEPGAAPLPGSGPAKPTLFSTPVRVDDEMQSTDTAEVMDPHNATGRNDSGLTPEEASRLERQTQGLTDDEIDLETATVEEVATWIKEDSVTVTELVDAAEDPVLAQKLIDAENMATGGKPRKTAIKQLQEIVDSSDEPTYSEEALGGMEPEERRRIASELGIAGDVADNDLVSAILAAQADEE